MVKELFAGGRREALSAEAQSTMRLRLESQTDLSAWDKNTLTLLQFAPSRLLAASTVGRYMVKISLVILSLSTLSPSCWCVSVQHSVYLLSTSLGFLLGKLLWDKQCWNVSHASHLKRCTSDSYCWHFNKSLIEQRQLMSRGKQWLDPPPQCTSQCQDLRVQVRTPTWTEGICGWGNKSCVEAGGVLAWDHMAHKASALGIQTG